MKCLGADPKGGFGGNHLVSSPLPNSDAFGTMRKPLFRSVPTLTTNSRAVCRERDETLTFVKLCVVVRNPQSHAYLQMQTKAPNPQSQHH